MKKMKQERGTVKSRRRRSGSKKEAHFMVWV